MSSLVHRQVASPYDVITGWFRDSLEPQAFERNIHQLFEQLTEDRNPFNNDLKLSFDIRKVVNANPIYPGFKVRSIGVVLSNELDLEGFGVPRNNPLLFHASHWQLNTPQPKFVIVLMKFQNCENLSFCFSSDSE